MRLWQNDHCHNEETHPLLSILGLDIVLTDHNVVCLIVNFFFKIGLTNTQYTTTMPAQPIVKIALINTKYTTPTTNTGGK